MQLSGMSGRPTIFSRVCLPWVPGPKKSLSGCDVPKFISGDN